MQIEHIVYFIITSILSMFIC